MINYVILIIICLIGIISLFEYEYCIHKQNIEWNNYINNAKKELEGVGFIFNHSHQLVNKKDNSKIRFLRIFELKYNPNTKKVYAHCYMTTKEREIGTWYDDYKYLLEIPTRWNLVDNGEWNPK